MRACGSIFILLMSGAWALAPVGAAHAQSSGRVLVLQLSSDFLSGSTAADLDRHLRKKLRAARPRRFLPKPAVDLASLQLVAGCGDDGPRCFALIGRTAQAASVVQVSIVGSAERARLLVRQVDSRTEALTTYKAGLRDVSGSSREEIAWHVATALGLRPAPLTGRVELTNDLQVGSLEGATVLLDDRIVLLSALEQMNPGRHRIEVRQDGFEPFVWIGMVRPGRNTKVPIRFVPRPRFGEDEEGAFADAPGAVPPDRGSSPVAEAGPIAGADAIDDDSGPLWTWILGASALAAAGTATVFGVQVLSLESDAESAGLDCDGDDRNADTCADGRSRALLSNVTWAVAGALAVSAVVAYFLETDSPEADGAAMSTRVGVAPTQDGVSAAIEITF